MRYLLCFIFPPLAVLACNKPGQAALNLLLTCCLWLPGTLHALFVVADTNANERTRMVVNAINPQQPQLRASQQPEVRRNGHAGLIILCGFIGLVVIGSFHRAENTSAPKTTASAPTATEDPLNVNRLVVNVGHDGVGTPPGIGALTDAQIRAQNDIALSHLKRATVNTSATPAKVLRLWKNARLDVWEKNYGKPETITGGKEADGFNSLNDTPASYRWNVERLELTVAFGYQDGHEIKIDVEARDGKDPLTLSEAQTFASALGLSGPISSSRNPTAADALENHWQTWSSGNFVAYFNDTYPEATSFYFENSSR